MIVKLTNKDSNFYTYMGRFFGSRIVENETKDRIYDDNNKVWYVYLHQNDKPSAFISMSDGVIKNIYSVNDVFLKELLLFVKQDCVILDSIITKAYENIYIDCGFDVCRLDNYKHFILIRGDNHDRN